MEDFDKKIAQFLVTLAPPGSGPEARSLIMAALADVMGMYLAGDLAKMGRTQYLRSARALMDRMAGIAETSAVQLRPQGKSELVGFAKTQPDKFTSPPDDMDDYLGEKGVMLSALGALIDVGEMQWWLLPGWPAARARTTKDGIEIQIAPDAGLEYPGSTWHLRQLETESKTFGTSSVG